MKHFILLPFIIFTLHLTAQDSTRYSSPGSGPVKSADTVEYRDLRELTSGENNERDSTIAAEHAADPADTFPMTKKELFKKGEEDEATYYRKPGQVFAVSFLTTLFAGPVIGLAPALACSLTFKEKNANFPDYAIAKNADYRKGYLRNCKRAKIATAWGGWASATLIDGLVAGLVYWAVRVNK